MVRPIVGALALGGLAACSTSPSHAYDCFGGCYCYRAESPCTAAGCAWVADAGCSMPGIVKHEDAGDATIDAGGP
jgi:hypothetical protein